MQRRTKILIAAGMVAVIFVSAYTISGQHRKATKEPQIIELTEVVETDKMSETAEETEPPELPYDEEELELLAHLINGEAGADYCSDDLKFYVGSVALNRVASEYFPNTLEAVIFQEGQYACTWDGNYDKEPSEACYEIAEELLIYGSVLPENVLFQAEFKQGDGTYCKEQNMYFCYKEKEEAKK